MKKWIVLILVLVGGGWGVQKWRSTMPKDAPGAVAGRPTTAVVDSRDIRFAVNAAGDIGPAEQVSVRPEVNGKIAELPVDIGDKVRKNDLLCRLDDKDLQIERLTRLAEIDGAK